MRAAAGRGLPALPFPAITDAIRGKTKRAETGGFGSFRKNLAATYSRGGYTTTTIGNAAFDGRVRDGNGSDHSFMATKKLIKNNLEGFREVP